MVLKSIIAVCWLAGALLLPSGGGSDIASDKKVHKAISRTWELEQFSVTAHHIRPEVMSFLGTGNPLAIYDISSSDSLIGYLYLSSAKGRYDYFDFLVLYDLALRIINIEVLTYRSDHGFEICNRSWLSQFQGKTGCETIYGKDIDAISGATLSASHLTLEVARMCEIMQLVAPAKKNSPVSGADHGTVRESLR